MYWWIKKLNMAQQCTLTAQKSQLHPRLHQMKRGQKVKGIDLTTQSWEEWLVHQSAVLTFRKTSTDWKDGQRTAWNSAKARGGSCTWRGLIPCTGWGLTCWEAALRRGTWGSWWTKNCPWASSVSQGTMVSWGVLGKASQGR